MNSIIQTIRKNSLIPGFTDTQSLPLSQTNDGTQPSQPALRRRLSSASLKIQQQLTSPGASSWSAFRRSKSISSMGDYAGGSILKLWAQGWSWIMSRKPVFSRDLEMNEEEVRVVGELEACAVQGQI